MSVYILHTYDEVIQYGPIAGSKPCIMTADNEKELHVMAKLIYATEDQFCTESDCKFYILSRSQMKKARNNGALIGDDAKEMIRFKKTFPIMKQHEAENDG